jgi:hypothetical protein
VVTRSLMISSSCVDIATKTTSLSVLGLLVNTRHLFVSNDPHGSLDVLG